MVTVAKREVPVFGATVRVTVPLPEPLPEPANVTQGTSLAADHAQFPGAVTLTVVLWPSEGDSSDAGLIANVHPCWAAS